MVGIGIGTGVGGIYHADIGLQFPDIGRYAVVNHSIKLLADKVDGQIIKFVWEFVKRMDEFYHWMDGICHRGWRQQARKAMRSDEKKKGNKKRTGRKNRWKTGRIRRSENFDVGEKKKRKRQRKREKIKDMHVVN